MAVVELRTLRYRGWRFSHTKKDDGGGERKVANFEAAEMLSKRMMALEIIFFGLFYPVCYSQWKS